MAITCSTPLITSLLIRATTSAGEASTSPYARNAFRSCPMDAAARSPCPATSPTTSATRPSVSVFPAATSAHFPSSFGSRRSSS